MKEVESAIHGGFSHIVNPANPADTAGIPGVASKLARGPRLRVYLARCSHPALYKPFNAPY